MPVGLKALGEHNGVVVAEDGGDETDPDPTASRTPSSGAKNAGA